MIFTINKLIEYLSFLLVISYLLLHNIILVLIGVFLALYEIRKSDSNKKITNTINENHFIKKEIQNKIKANIIDEYDDKLVLVEEVEQLGYIPLLKKKVDRKAS